MKLLEFKNYQELSKAAADIVIDSIRVKPDLVLGLPTGSTPIGMYDCLAKEYSLGKVDFAKVVTFNLDEYVGLQPSSPHSYKYFMTDKLYSRVNLDPKNTHIPNGVAKDLELESKSYDDMIDKAGGIDLFVVGIGQNGHIAFNEPAIEMPAFTHVVELTESTIQANSRLFDDISKVPKKALTQGMATILKAKKIILLSSGQSKREALDRMLSGVLTLDCPATLLNLHRDVTVLVCD